MANDFRLLIVTGMSGAGKSGVLQNLEDLGYFCVDNLPPVLIPKFAELCRGGVPRVQQVALVVDIRGGEFFEALTEALAELAAEDYAFDIAFLEASDDVLIRRYKETRRAHPLAPQERILQGIRREREILAGIKARAQLVIDTSDWTPQALRSWVRSRFASVQKGEEFVVSVVSFGFKHGMPPDLDIMWDVRFLPNPYYIEEYRHCTGRVAEVSEYIGKWDVTKEFMTKLYDLLDFLVPHYEEEGKQQLVIGVGCTGGMHRSVWVAEQLAAHFRKGGLRVHVEHRDLAKNDVRKDCEPEGV